MFVAIPVIVQVEFVESFACGHGHTLAMFAEQKPYFLTNQCGLRGRGQGEDAPEKNRRIGSRGVNGSQGWLGFSPRKANESTPEMPGRTYYKTWESSWDFRQKFKVLTIQRLRSSSWMTEPPSAGMVTTPQTAI
jgi:hypothetical protein